MKPLRFFGDSLKQLRDFGIDARKDAGFQLDRVPRELDPNDAKALSVVGPGVRELRLWDKTGTYRVIYLARLPGAVYVLHAFQKKTQATRMSDLNLAQTRLQQLLKERR